MSSQNKTTTSVSIAPELKEWADREHPRLGYSSRSALLEDLLRQERDRQEGQADA